MDEEELTYSDFTYSQYMAIIQFCDKVCDRAEIEGAHYAAMETELRELKRVFDERLRMLRMEEQHG